MTAVIFDMDGVLVDGEPLHFNAARALLAEFGADLDLASYKGFVGQTLEGVWPRLQARFDLPLTLDAYRARYETAILAQYRAHAIPMPGAVAAVRGVRAAGYGCALASSSRRTWVDTALAALGLAGAFDVTLSGDEVAHGKPDPEIYTTTAARLGEPPAACLVVEDSPAGVESARRAGMRVIGVRTAMTTDLPLDGAARIIDSLTQFNPRWAEEGVRDV